MNIVKIPLKDSLIKKIEGKTLIEWNINSNGELELKVEECQLFDRLEKLDKEIDDGDFIETDMDSLAKELQL
ncbi:MAG: hypothetical protein ACRCVG_05050 [Methanobacteriaceae archaeon]